jgi:cyclopropane fatty-acyl-phospholipid synthase-like methyltransferase
MTDPDWWAAFFAGPWIDAQRAAWSSDQTQSDADAVEALLQLAPGSDVLDVPCGEGRVALELAARGHRVHGIDLTEALLETARARATERGLPATFEQRDMRTLDAVEAYDGAFCWWGSFGYFPDDDNEIFAGAVARALRPGGRFVIDTHVADSILPRFTPRGWWEAGDVTVLEDRRWDHEAGRVETEWTLIRATEPPLKRSSSIRAYTYRELAGLLRRAGFASVEAFDRTTMEPFTLGAGRTAMVGVTPA